MDRPGNRRTPFARDDREVLGGRGVVLEPRTVTGVATRSAGDTCSSPAVPAGGSDTRLPEARAAAVCRSCCAVKPPLWLAMATSAARSFRRRARHQLVLKGTVRLFVAYPLPLPRPRGNSRAIY